MTIHFDLRPYQQEAIKSTLTAFNSKESGGLLYLATGTGKTVIASEIARRINKRVLFLVHREELVNQTLKKFMLFYPDASCGIVKAGMNQLGRQVTIASIQTVSSEKRLTQLKENGPYDLIIADECHHFGDNSWKKVLDNIDGFKLGLTATPNRSDNVSLSSTFSNIIYRYSIIDGIKEKWLSDIKGINCKIDVDLDNVKVAQGDFQTSALTKEMSRPEIINYSIDTWQKHASKRKTIVFAVSVEHAEMLSNAFNLRGIKSECLTGNTTKEDRKDILKRYSNGETQVLTSCMVLTEGFDSPNTDCVLLARPTLSESLYIQMVGRGLRKYPDKKNCLVIDLVSNSSKHRLMQLGILLGYDKSLEKEKKKKNLIQKDIDLGNIESIRNLIVHESDFDIENYNKERQFEWVEVEQGLLLSMGYKIGFLLIEPDSIEDATYKINHLYSQPGQNKTDILSEGLNLEWCISIAEKEAERFIGNQNINMYKKEQTWRLGAPSDRQLTLLSQMGYEKEVQTKGEASKLISKLLFERLTKPEPVKIDAPVKPPEPLQFPEKIKALEPPKIPEPEKSLLPVKALEPVKLPEYVKPEETKQGTIKPLFGRRTQDLSVNINSNKRLTISEKILDKVLFETRKMNIPTWALLSDGKILSIDPKNKIVNIVFENPAHIELLKRSKYLHIEKAFENIFNCSYKINFICLDEEYNKKEMERLNLTFNDERGMATLPS